MKRLLLLLIAATTLLPSRVLQSQEAIRLRILSYNIHHGQGIDGKLDLKRIADVIASVEPDIVALQEVDQKVERTGGVDQAAELARQTNMNVAFGANIELQGGHYGNAVLSRFPIAHRKNHLLPNHDSGEQRGVLEVEINLPETDKNVVLLATHLDHRANEKERLASAKFINDLVAQRTDTSFVLAGDLNATPNSKTIQRLESRWTRASQKPMPTVPVADPKKQIDYVHVRDSKQWKPIEFKVLDEAIASDHRAILAVMDFVASNENNDHLLRIACVGDSITAAARVDATTESYPAQLQKILGSRVDVRNFGIGGATLIKAGRPNIWQQLEAIEAFQPEIVVVSLGTNDTVSGNRKNWERIGAFDDDYSELIQKMTKWHSQPKIILCTPTAMVLETPGLTDQRRTDLAERKPRLQKLCDQIRELAAKHAQQNVSLLELNEVLKSHPEWLTETDGVHPNAEGYLAVARAVAKHIRLQIELPAESTDGDGRRKQAGDDSSAGSKNHGGKTSLSNR